MAGGGGRGEGKSACWQTEDFQFSPQNLHSGGGEPEAAIGPKHSECNEKKKDHRRIVERKTERKGKEKSLGWRERPEEGCNRKPEKG